MSSYQQPEFLPGENEPRHRVRCPIHGFIRYSPNERRVIDHRLFRRLRYIRQLALTEFVYPGATHTRFEHSLGVMEVATRAFDGLATRHGDLMEATFRRVAGFATRPMALARQYLRLAALLHDVGHASFSHAAEKVVQGGLGHETLTLAILRQKDLLGGRLDALFGEGCAARVAQIIEGGRDLPPQLRVLHDLVSSELDADRTDYLSRDSLHCGVEYGRFDYLRLIESLTLLPDPAGGLEIALHVDGIHAFEALILARYQMSTQVYFHRLRRIYDEYLVRYHRALGEPAFNSPRKVLAQNDVTMLARIFRDAERDQGDRSVWARRIRDRNHHWLVHETSYRADARDLRRSREVLSILRQSYPDREFLDDVVSGTIHKLLIPGDPDEREHVILSLVGRDGSTRDVAEGSQVLSSLPRKLQCARIFVDLSAEEEELRREIRARAVREWEQRGGR